MRFHLANLIFTRVHAALAKDFKFMGKPPYLVLFLVHKSVVDFANDPITDALGSSPSNVSQCPWSYPDATSDTLSCAGDIPAGAQLFAPFKFC